MGHSERSTDEALPANGQDPVKPQSLPGAGNVRKFTQVKCVICGGWLDGAGRKLHEGTCARQRKTELQRLRRRRRRV